LHTAFGRKLEASGFTAKIRGGMSAAVLRPVHHSAANCTTVEAQPDLSRQNKMKPDLSRQSRNGKGGLVAP
jgi:hypothetical protein